MTDNAALLEITNLSVSIEGSPIVNGLDVVLDAGEAVGLIGRNGAGKTTTFKGIMGQATVTDGSIRFAGAELTETPPKERSKLGIGYQPENRGLFTGMTVDENFRIPIWVAQKHGKQVNEEAIISDIYDTFPELADFRNSNVENLSGGQAKMVSIGRALALQPDLLLLDEPLEGLAPAIVEDIKEIVRSINDQGIAVLIAEANLSHAMELVDRVYIIDRGGVFDSGPATELIEKPEVQLLLQG